MRFNVTFKWCYIGIQFCFPALAHALIIDSVKIDSSQGERLYAEIPFSNAQSVMPIGVEIEQYGDFGDETPINSLSPRPSYFNTYVRQNAQGDGVIIITSTRPIQERNIQLTLKVTDGNQTRLQKISSYLPTRADRLQATLEGMSLQPKYAVRETTGQNHSQATQSTIQAQAKPATTASQLPSAYNTTNLNAKQNIVERASSVEAKPASTTATTRQAQINTPRITAAKVAPTSNSEKAIHNEVIDSTAQVSTLAAAVSSTKADPAAKQSTKTNSSTPSAVNLENAATSTKIIKASGATQPSAKQIPQLSAITPPLSAAAAKPTVKKPQASETGTISNKVALQPNLALQNSKTNRNGSASRGTVDSLQTVFAASAITANMATAKQPTTKATQKALITAANNTTQPKLAAAQKTTVIAADKTQPQPKLTAAKSSTEQKASTAFNNTAAIISAPTYITASAATPAAQKTTVSSADKTQPQSKLTAAKSNTEQKASTAFNNNAANISVPTSITASAATPAAKTTTVLAADKTQPQSKLTAAKSNTEQKASTAPKSSTANISVPTTSAALASTTVKSATKAATNNNYNLISVTRIDPPAALAKDKVEIMPTAHVSTEAQKSTGGLFKRMFATDAAQAKKSDPNVLVNKLGSAKSSDYQRVLKNSKQVITVNRIDPKAYSLPTPHTQSLPSEAPAKNNSDSDSNFAQPQQSKQVRQPSSPSIKIKSKSHAKIFSDNHLNTFNPSVIYRLPSDFNQA